jgi:two-component system sensor histidine kinase BarA
VYPTTPKGAGPRPTHLPVWDETTAVAAVAGNARLARELIAALIAALPADLAELHACAARNDQAALAETAHHLRGATRYCGVLALDAALKDLERAAKAGDTRRMAADLALVEIEAARLITACG